jgi:hypothetical protein
LSVTIPLTPLAVLLLGIWALLRTLGNVSKTAALVLIIIAIVLAIIDMIRPYAGRRVVP